MSPFCESSHQSIGNLNHCLWSRPSTGYVRFGGSARSHSLLFLGARDFRLVSGRRLSGSIFCHSSRTLGEDCVLPNGGKKREVEKLWRELFCDPSEWRDHRTDKANPNFPDFKHKKTQQGLWLDSRWIPPWVEERVAAIPPGTLEVSIYSWNQRLSRYAKAGQYEKTMELFQEMQRNGINSDRFTFAPVLNACSNLGVLQDGRRIHAQIIENGFDADIYLGSSLVDMYAKCGSMEDAERVFKEMSARDVVAWTAMILGYVKCGDGLHALELFEQMQLDGVDPDSVTFVAALNACASLGVLEGGQCIHAQILEKGFDADIYVANSLVGMYAKCGSIMHAERVFNRMPTRNVVAWTTMILGYVKSGQGQKGLELYKQMELEGVEPNPVTFVAVLNACASLAELEEGKHAHEQIRQRGYECNVYVGSSLVDMYAKCGSIADAERVFNKMPMRNVVAWTAMILGYVQCGEGWRALELYQWMEQEGVEPESVTFVAVLNACASVAALEQGRCAHEQIIQRGFESDVFVGSSLVDMYAKCGTIADAERVFNQMPMRGVVAWNAMIMGYVKCGEGRHALDLFEQMKGEGMNPDSVTFVAVLNACARLAVLEEGKHIHEHIILRGYESDVFVGSSLVDMYSKCGSIGDAERVFEEMPSRDAVAWTAMMLAYVKCGEMQHALELFRQMQWDGVDPESETFVVVLNACTSLQAIEEGRHVHGQIIQRGYELDVSVGSSLVDMYGKCGSIMDAEKVFKQMPMRNAVAWTAMILGYMKYGEGHRALELYQQMEVEGVPPESGTYVAVLNACASVTALKEGRRAHEQIIQGGFETNVYVGSSLNDMYAKCGNLHDAERVFNQMPIRNVVAWTAMILGYVQCGEGWQALELYRQMEREEVDLDSVAFVAVLNACASVAALKEGKCAHDQIIQRGYDSDANVVSSLIDMYAKCGSLVDAERVFNEMPTRDVVAWTAMLAGYAWHGFAERAVEHFKQMCQFVEVNDVTFVSLLSACSHGGLVDEGLEFFKSMNTVYNISPKAVHYACVIDVLGRAGRLHEAEEMITSMPFKADAFVWMSLLGACRVHGNVELGECSAKQVLELDPENAAGYVALSNIYAAAGKWDSSASLNQERFERCEEDTWV